VGSIRVLDYCRVMGEPGKVSRLLGRLSAGDRSVQDELMELVYSELKKIAAAVLRGQNRDATLSRTALVHETCVRLLEDGANISWKSRGHFFAMAAVQMRRILIDHARNAKAQKRYGGLKRIPFEAISLIAEGYSDYVLAIDDALKRLETLDARQAQVVEMRVFGGFSCSEIAKALDISDRSVKRDWSAARAWLHRELDGLRAVGAAV
jgi:RNA polymerase sigma-70 factor, ECF subfamily